ncbi:pectinesterase inhibitor-like [Vitis vinifera]|nr:pectinesterase inhibitor-like [Vitis vinifera]XP_059592637.1 pectinesterase inhibitor-like [Vitis vinifera]XP_059592643.1 pectinesterase inhibitor-like [Vitis vinifera]XP_059592648.1 pectinesterase inhibitor-like [Vitis vinifera]|eukprot:XP_010650026.1 PREDICTED: pectinesterase inhibitor-like [Vitis vinifera]
MNDALVEKLCAKSTDPSFCANALKSDPRSAIADITTFEQIAINLTKANATDTWNFVNLNAGQNNDPKIKAAYQRCSPLYEDIIAATDDATTSLEALDYRDLDTEGESIMDSADECDQLFTKPSQMSDRNRFARLLGEMIALIGDVLISG